MIRLKDVAVRAGVSLMTVSKVLRDASDVSVSTKARVRQLAEEMGYVPDALARGLRTRTTRLFGVVVPSVSHPVLSQVLMAIEDRAHELGYDLLLAQSQDHVQREELCLRRLLSRHIDGLFLYPVYRLSPTAPVYEELYKSGTPTVLLGHRAPFCSPFFNIESDDATGSYQMTRHLLGLGHHRIAFFAGPPSAPWAQERFAGYRRALREAQIALDDALIFSAGSTIQDGEKAALQFFNESATATAIQTASDLLAVGAARMLREQGVSVPRDISLGGFGNCPLGEHLSVPLTTVQQPKYAIGLAATECLLRLLEGEKLESKRLNTELVIRKSTGPAPTRQAPSNHLSSQGDDLQ